MISLFAVSLLGVGLPVIQEDRTCHMIAFELGGISPKANAPPNWYLVTASATTDHQAVDRQVNVQAVVTYSYIDAEGTATQGQGTVILKGDGTAGNAAVALSGNFGALGSAARITDAKVETSLCLTDIQ